MLVTYSPRFKNCDIPDFGVHERYTKQFEIDISLENRKNYDVNDTEKHSLACLESVSK